MKIWEKYIFLEILKFIGFFLLGIYSVYTIIDFFTHSTRLFTYSSVHWYNIIYYYFNHFIIRLVLFLPLSFMLSIIKVLCDMNMHNEISTLQMAGISSKRILLPLFIIASMLSVFTYVNFEVFSPKANAYIGNFKNMHLKKKVKKDANIHTIILDNNTKLSYYSAIDKHKLLDVYWIKSNSDIWHMKYLDYSKKPVVGHYVDHLTKTENYFEKASSYKEFSFSDLNISNDELKIIPIEYYSLSKLIKENKSFAKNKRSQLLSNLHYKLSMPLLPFIMILAVAPYCLKYSRNLSVFFIVFLSIFSFFIFYTLIDSMLILCENQVFHPAIVMWSIFLFMFVAFGKMFIKKTS